MMSENVIITAILCLSALVLFLITDGVNGAPSLPRQLVAAWAERNLQRFKVEVLKAEHAAKCPRMTDKPRGRE